MAKITRLRDLTPDAKNANKGTERGTGMLEQSLRSYGAGRSILIDAKGRIIAGNKTVQEAGAIGMDKVQVVESDGTTIIAVQRTDLDLERDPKARELALADNRIAEVNLDYDKAVLGELAHELDLGNFFLENELKDLLEPEGDQEEPHTPDADLASLRNKYGTERGQLWQVGPHRLMCGDSTSTEDVAVLMDGKKAVLVNTDPPYGVNYNSLHESRPVSTQAHHTIYGDDLVGDALAAMLEKAFKNAVRHATEDASFYIWHATTTRQDFLLAMNAAGIVEKQYITWAKDRFAMGRNNYHWQSEPCFYACRSGQSPAWYGDACQTTVWRVSMRDVAGNHLVNISNGLRLSNGRGAEIYIAIRAPKQKKLRLVRLQPTEELQITAESQLSDVWSVQHDKYSGDAWHPTMKPAELAVRAIRNSSRLGENVLDLFGGAGFTMIGAHMTERRCYAMEIEPEYVAVILERMTSFGLQPQLLDDGKQKASKRKPAVALA